MEYTNELMGIIDYDYDNEYEFLELLRGFAKELKSNPNEVLKTVNKKIAFMEDELAEDGICPDCGEKLEWESNGEDTYVPYGSTSVCYERGGAMVCPHCGYEKE